MKQISSKGILSILVISILFGFINNPDINKLQKDKKFKVIITYDITYSGDIDPATLASQPKDMIVKIMGNKTRQEYGGTSIIYDGDTKTNIILIDVANKKYALKTTKEDIEKKLERKPAPKIKYIEGETKTIAGYLCKKAEITETDPDNGEEVTTTLFYTDEFGSEDMNYGTQFHGLNGWPLEYEMTGQNITIKYTAHSINKKAKISEADFLIPDDYQITSKEKLMELFGGDENE